MDIVGDVIARYPLQKVKQSEGTKIYGAYIYRHVKDHRMEVVVNYRHHQDSWVAQFSYKPDTTIADCEQRLVSWCKSKVRWADREDNKFEQQFFSRLIQVVEADTFELKGE
jgi:hypothetical protein